MSRNSEHLAFRQWLCKITTLFKRKTESRKQKCCLSLIPADPRRRTIPGRHETESLKGMKCCTGCRDEHDTTQPPTNEPLQSAVNPPVLWLIMFTLSSANAQLMSQWTEAAFVYNSLVVTCWIIIWERTLLGFFYFERLGDVCYRLIFIDRWKNSVSPWI